MAAALALNSTASGGIHAGAVAGAAGSSCGCVRKRSAPAGSVAAASRSRRSIPTAFHAAPRATTAAHPPSVCEIDPVKRSGQTGFRSGPTGIGPNASPSSANARRPHHRPVENSSRLRGTARCTYASSSGNIGRGPSIGDTATPEEGPNHSRSRPAAASSTWSCVNSALRTTMMGILMEAPMQRRMRLAVALMLAVGGSPVSADWPQWRGPHGSGIADDANVPDRWSAAENLVWKAPLAGLGVSSPIVSGDRVFVTSQVGAGVRRPGNHPRLAQGSAASSSGERALPASRDDRTMFVVEAFQRSDGRQLWEYRMEAAGPLPGVHDKHNLASPSPVTDGQMVYAWFGTGQIVALDMAGKVVWAGTWGRRSRRSTSIGGTAARPHSSGIRLILLSDHAPAAYLLAVDKRTGRDRWKTD